MGSDVGEGLRNSIMIIRVTGPEICGSALISHGIGEPISNKIECDSSVNSIIPVDRKCDERAFFRGLIYELSGIYVISPG